MSKKGSFESKEAKKGKQKRLPCFNVLTILLLLFFIQLTISFFVNTAKVYSLQTKINKLEELNKAAQRKNVILRDELDKYTSNTGIEALARNRLQLTENDETLIILKNNDEY